MTSKPTYFYPNRMGRILLLAMEEILGHSGVNAVLNLANLPDYINNYLHTTRISIFLLDISAFCKLALKELMDLKPATVWPCVWAAPVLNTACVSLAPNLA